MRETERQRQTDRQTDRERVGVVVGRVLVSERRQGEESERRRWREKVCAWESE